MPDLTEMNAEAAALAASAGSAPYGNLSLAEGVSQILVTVGKSLGEFEYSLWMGDEGEGFRNRLRGNMIEVAKLASELAEDGSAAPEVLGQAAARAKEVFEHLHKMTEGDAIAQASMGLSRIVVGIGLQLQTVDLTEASKRKWSRVLSEVTQHAIVTGVLAKYP